MWQYNVSPGFFNAGWWFCKSVHFASDVLEDIIMPWGNSAGNQNLFPQQTYYFLMDSLQKGFFSNYIRYLQLQNLFFFLFRGVKISPML